MADQTVSLRRSKDSQDTTERPLRILIVRVSAIGDVIHGIPVLCALRKA